jgi:hypothetical protein
VGCECLRVLRDLLWSPGFRPAKHLNEAGNLAIALFERAGAACRDRIEDGSERRLAGRLGAAMVPWESGGQPFFGATDVFRQLGCGQVGGKTAPTAQGIGRREEPGFAFAFLRLPVGSDGDIPVFSKASLNYRALRLSPQFGPAMLKATIMIPISIGPIPSPCIRAGGHCYRSSHVPWSHYEAEL